MEEASMKALQQCRWSPRWVSHLGCIKGCLDYLGAPISGAWLYGGTGHAFVINVHDEVCPSGPTAWDTSKLSELGGNLGYRVDGVLGSRWEGDLKPSQERAWDLTRRTIDDGRPCYGWDLKIPEFYVVYGYDEVGYYYAGPGCVDGEGPKPWQTLGETEIGVVQLYAMALRPPASDARTVVEALSFALKHASHPNEWVFERYRTGPGAYDNWVHALENGHASDHGMRYNAAVWLECRRKAVGFLKEAKRRLAGRADQRFDEALAQYAQVADRLAEVAEAYPWLDVVSEDALVPRDSRSDDVIEALGAAKRAEMRGLTALEGIVSALASL
jgi:hypothetical protein